MNDVVRLSALCGLLLVTASAFAADVVVNGLPLNESARKSLEQKYGVPIKPGRYWYDNVSGVWGPEGDQVPARFMQGSGSAVRFDGMPRKATPV